MILVADDDPDHAALVGLLLTRGGHRVVIVEDGVQALARLRRGGIGAAVLDVQMPGLQGSEVCAAARSELGLDRLPVVLLSGLPPHVLAAEARRVGADAHLTKPVSPRALLTVVDRLALARLTDDLSDDLT